MQVSSLKYNLDSLQIQVIMSIYFTNHAKAPKWHKYVVGVLQDTCDMSVRVPLNGMVMMRLCVIGNHHQNFGQIHCRKIDTATSIINQSFKQRLWRNISQWQIEPLLINLINTSPGYFMYGILCNLCDKWIIYFILGLLAFGFIWCTRDYWKITRCEVLVNQKSGYSFWASYYYIYETSLLAKSALQKVVTRVYMYFIKLIEFCELLKSEDSQTLRRISKVILETVKWISHIT